MVQPLEALKINNSALGSELSLTWTKPTDLPEDYKIYVFKKSGSTIPQQLIDDYFDSINDLTGFNYEGVFVFDKLENNTTVLADYVVLNGTQYYYKAVIRNEDDGEYSTALEVSDIPEALIAAEVIDGKDRVAQVITKMFDTLKTKTGQKVDFRKEIDIVKHFSVDDVGRDRIMIERVNAADYQRFSGNLLNMYKGSAILGSVDTDVIRATYLTPASPERRDLICNAFRARKFWIEIMMKKLGARHCTAIVEGDYYNPMFHGANVVGFTIVITILFENQLKYTGQEITQHITDMEIV